MNHPSLVKTFLFSVIALLSGCASLNSTFDCPMKPGVMCKSLDEVNSMVDQGKLGRDDSIEEVPPSLTKTYSSETAFEPPSTFTHSGERIARIWIAPIEDGGDYTTSTVLYRTIKPSITNQLKPLH